MKKPDPNKKVKDTILKDLITLGQAEYSTKIINGKVVITNELKGQITP